VYTSPATRSTSPHNATPYQMVNQRLGILAKEKYTCVLKSSRECVLESDRFLQAKKDVSSLLKMVDQETLLNVVLCTAPSRSVISVTLLIKSKQPPPPKDVTYLVIELTLVTSLP